MKRSKTIIILTVLAFATVVPAAFCPDAAGQDYDHNAVWVKELESAMASHNAPGGPRLKLSGYSYRGEITSEAALDTLLEEIFDDEAIIADGNTDDAYFDHMADIFPKIAPREPAEGEEYLNGYLAKGTGVVDLEWSYEGEKYHSVAVVSDDYGILYDNIGCNVTTGEILSTKEKAEKDTAKDAYSVSWGQSITSNDCFGRPVYFCTWACTSTFNSEGILTGTSMGSEHEGAFGWICETGIEQEVGEGNNYHCFSWDMDYEHVYYVLVRNGNFMLMISAGSSGRSQTQTVTLRKVLEML